MAFVRDHGAACLCLPLKLFIGIVCMYVFTGGCFAVVGVFKNTMPSSHSNSVNLQFGGYAPDVAKLQVMINAIGLVMGFFGLLGIYDDKPGWVRTFMHYLQVRLIINLIVFLADLWTLRDCSTYAATHEGAKTINAAVDQLSSQDMCHWGRIAYIIGYCIMTALECYMLYYVWVYVNQLELNPPYAIDFGYERYDKTARWQFYQVQEPEEMPLFVKPEKDVNEDLSDNRITGAYAPDGSKAANTYTPDGMRGPSYVRGFRATDYMSQAENRASMV